jgi:hypothetical protein
VKTEPGRFVDTKLERRAGIVSAKVALVYGLDIGQADSLVIAVLQAFDLAVEHVGSSPEREHLLAPFRKPPAAVSHPESR